MTDTRKRTSIVTFLSEPDVTRQVCDALKYRGWRAHRLNAGKWVPWAEAMRYAKAGGRLGLVPAPKKLVPREWGDEFGPDWLFVHPDHGAMYVEIKAEGKRPSKGQKGYLNRLGEDGVQCCWTDGLSSFMVWYGERYR